MDWFDRRIVRYVLLWAAWDGLEDEDVYPQFGMRVPQLHKRFDRIVGNAISSWPQLDDEDRDLLSRAREYQQSRHEGQRERVREGE